ncbi:MAG: ABC transporter permease, partial [Bryobacteraceae bacterium]
ALGQTLTVDGRACTISGVMPDGFAMHPHGEEFWIPLPANPQTRNRGADFLQVIARRKTGVTLAAAQSELKLIARRLDRAYPNDDKAKFSWHSRIATPLSEMQRPHCLLSSGPLRCCF